LFPKIPKAQGAFSEFPSQNGYNLGQKIPRGLPLNRLPRPESEGGIVQQQTEGAGTAIAEGGGPCAQHQIT